MSWWSKKISRRKKKSLFVTDQILDKWPRVDRQKKYPCQMYVLMCPSCHEETICYSESSYYFIGRGEDSVGVCCKCEHIFRGDTNA